MARKRYPSDHRRWFRVMEDILDDPGYRKLSAQDKVAWLDLLAIFNRRQAHRTGNQIILSWGAAMVALAAQNRRGALARAARLARGVSAHFAQVERGLLCYIPKWSELQGLTPTRLRRDSDETPATTPTPTPTPTTPTEERAEPSRTPSGKSRWLNLLKGPPPNGYRSAEEWLSEHLPIVEGEADKELGKDADATQRNGAIKARLCRYWRNKSGPPSRASPPTAPKYPSLVGYNPAE